MPLILSGNVGSATAATTYSIANSCRWAFGDSPAMNKSQTAGNKKTWTYSWWCKRGVISGSAENDWFKVYASGSKLLHIRFNTNDTLYVEGETPNSIRLTTNRVFRDPSAWYHFALIMDTTQSTAANRMKLFVNGKNELTDGLGFASVTYPTEDGDTAMNDSGATFYLGTTQSATEEFDGYMAEVVLLDGTAAAIGDLGEFDSNSPTIWKPKDPSGLSFGNNGFWLDFEDSSNLGNDKNGGTDFSESNLAAIDQCTDTPTNNFCVMNPLDNYHFQSTYTQGNCKLVTGGSGRETYTTGTMGVSKGKWYYEVKVVTASGGDTIGWSDKVSDNYNDKLSYENYQIAWRGTGGQAYVNGTATADGFGTYTDGDVLGIYIDLDNLEMYFAKNGTLENSGTGLTITAASSTLGFYLPAIGDEESDSLTAEVNFGNPVSALSSAVADANGYGQFEYSPSGTFDGASKDFYAICTKNLAEFGG